jgi:altronate dehydratase
VISSIGIVTHAGHQLLIAVLSDGQPTRDDGIRQAQAAARAAVSAMTGSAATAVPR